MVPKFDRRLMSCFPSLIPEPSKIHVQICERGKGMFWIILGGILLALFYLLIFSLCKAAKLADRAIELNLREMRSEHEDGIDNILFEELFDETTHQGSKIRDNGIETCHDFVSLTKMGLVICSK